MSHQIYDYIIVGAGTAGSVIAARLVEDTDATVLLVEGGGAAQPAASANPPEWQTLLRSAADLGGPTTTQAATGTEIHLARGRGIGGSSTINAMTFLRGHRDSYADLNQFGAKGWTFDDLLPYFRRSETATHGDSCVRGVEGPLVVAPASPLNEITVALLTAAIQSGYPRAHDISGGLEIGFGPADLTIVNGVRQSAADAYLLPAWKDRICISSPTPWCTGFSSRTGGAPESSIAIAAATSPPHGPPQRWCLRRAASVRRIC